MNTAGFETLIEYRRGFLEQILSEERLRADSPLAQTFGSIGSFDVGDLTVDDAVVTVARGGLSLAMLPESNGIRIVFSQADAILQLQTPSAPAAVLYDMTTVLTIEGEVRSATAGEQVLVGLDTGTVTVAASVTSGHPLDDNLFLSEVLESGMHDLYAGGAIPAGPQTQLNQPFGVFSADVSVEIENNVGPEAAPLRSLRVLPLAANRINFLVPIDLRFSNITPSDANADFEPAIALRCVVQVPADVVRQLAVAPASVSIQIDPGEATVVLVEVYEGQATAVRPDVAAIIDAVLDELAAETAQRLSDEVQPIDALTLDEINAEIANLVLERLVDAMEILPFWQRGQDADFTDATPVVLDATLVIAVNSGPDADAGDIESFLPAGEDFAVFFDDEPFLDALDLWIHTPDTQSSIVGSCRVAGADQTGMELQVDGFGDVPVVFAETRIRIADMGTFILAEDADVEDGAATVVLTREIEDAPNDNAAIEFLSAFVQFPNQTGDSLLINGLVNDSGTIREGTRFTITGVEGEYRVIADATITAGQVLLQLDRELDSAPALRARLAFITGFGVPGRRFDAGGNDREVRIDEFTPSLSNGHINLTGPITVLRPHAVIKEIGGSVSVNLRLVWEDTVLGQGNVNADIVTDELPVHNLGTVTNIPAGTFVEVQGASEVRTLTEDAVVVDGETTALLDASLGPFAGNFATVRFVSATTRDLGTELVGNPNVELGGDGIGQNLIDALIGAIIGVFLAVFGFGIIGVLIFILSTFLREAIERLAGKQAGSQFGSAVAAPVPDELANISVNIASRFNNPITIIPDGVIMAGSASAQSEFRSLDDTQATTGAPYVSTAGSPLSFVGGLIADQTDYDWTAGDGALLVGRTPNHTYAQRGYRVARLTTVNRQFGDDIEVRNRDLGLVRVRNSRPVITSVTPIEGLEGHEVEITATFSDASWPDRHIAYVLFGDGTVPVGCEIVESNDAPAATGSAVARHTYCDNGTFTVTVKVIDAQGGSITATTTAVIENVDPSVDAGEEVFAYPCVPTRLVGRFEDVGWCDTHTGLWDFGDCSPPAAATIVETNEAPAARGTATATHCYEACGRFVAELTITDDDGGVGSDRTVVKVVDLRNGDFGEGFRAHSFGQVGNFWMPYVLGASPSVLAGQRIFFCEECVVFDEQRSQGIARVGGGALAAGIFQTVGANVGWDYQFSTFVQASTSAVELRIGIDPMGGDNPDAVSIVWTAVATSVDQWTPVAVRANAEADRVTVFIESRNQRADEVFIDAVDLKVFPCPVEKPKKDDEIPSQPEQCIDFSTIDPGPILSSGDNTIEGVVFETLDGSLLQFVTFGIPQGTFKLSIPHQGGLRVTFPEAVDSVTATVANANGAVTIIARNESASIVDSDSVDGPPGVPSEVAVQAEGIASVVIRSGTHNASPNLLRWIRIDRHLQYPERSHWQPRRR